VKPETEFQTLREELREWQARRFTLLGVTSVFLAAYIGWVVNKPDNWGWDVASIPIFLIVIGSSLLTHHFNRLVVRVSTYLEIFHDFKWQSRLSSYRESIGPLHTNQLIAVFYTGTILTAVLIFGILCKSHSSLYTLGISAILGLLTLAALGNMAFKSFPYMEYANAWRAAKQAETATQQENPADS
jgi:hypothetical protein